MNGIPRHNASGTGKAPVRAHERAQTEQIWRKLSGKRGADGLSGGWAGRVVRALSRNGAPQMWNFYPFKNLRTENVKCVSQG